MGDKKYPKFEKVDEHTIKIIREKIDDVPLSRLLKNKEMLLEQKKSVEENLKNIDETLKNIEEILENAEKLGIVPKETPEEQNPGLVNPIQ
jgi:hypothetical protein